MRKNLATRPAYFIESVDGALRLQSLLRDSGPLRVTDAANELGVAVSTAHRLLSMLVMHGYAMQDERRRYVAGPSLGIAAVRGGQGQELRRAVAPHLASLSRDLAETTNLMIRVGTRVRFLSSVEGPRLLRVGGRQGAVLPASDASGGKALLAELPHEQVVQLLGGAAAQRRGMALTTAELDRLGRELDGVRLRGYALNVEQTEEGVAAIGTAIHNSTGTAVAAISVSMPAVRFDRSVADGLAERLMSERQRIDQTLARIRLG